MKDAVRNVATTSDLVAAAADEAVRQIVVEAELDQVPPIALAPGVRLSGDGPDAALVFSDGVDGIQLGGDNEVTGLRVTVGPRQRSFHHSPSAAELGTIRLAGLTVTGQVQLIAAEHVRGGHVVVDGLRVVEADTRHRTQRPRLSGVGALQGGFTLWNANPDVVVTGSIRGFSAGSEQAPIQGSGVLVAGRLEIDLLQTGAVFTNGGIPDGTADTISGGVFVAHDAHVARVSNRGPVTTYGVNDMLLDNWGRVDNWTAEAPLTSYGRTGVGFVNFGTVEVLRVLGPIETHGIGGRGFNVYHLEGHPGASVGTAEFDSITTYGDGAVGIQIGQPIGKLIIRNGIHTHGGAGESLVKGVMTRLSAHALSVQPTGIIEELRVGGALISEGREVTPLQVLGVVRHAHIEGGIGNRTAQTEPRSRVTPAIAQEASVSAEPSPG